MCVTDKTIKNIVKLNPSPLPSKATAPSVLGTNATLEL
jgi:hypothetical protein